MLAEHTPILIPRGWYEKQAERIEMQADIIAGLHKEIAALKGDPLARMQGAYHDAGHPCGIKILERAKKGGTAKLLLVFPKKFGRGLAGLELEATYDPALGKVEIYRDKKVLDAAWLNYKPNGAHTLAFDETTWWTFGPSK